MKPVMVLKAGVVAWSAIGEGNASVHGAEPTRYGPDWGGIGDAPARLSTTFVSRAAIDAGFASSDSSAGRRRPRDSGPHQRSPRREPIRAPPASPCRPSTARSRSTAGCSLANRLPWCRSPAATSWRERSRGHARGVSNRSPARRVRSSVGPRRVTRPTTEDGPRARRRRGSPFARRCRRTTCRRAAATSSTTARPGCAPLDPSAHRTTRGARARGRTATTCRRLPPALRSRLATIAPALQPAYTAPRSIARRIAASSGESRSTSASLRRLPAGEVDHRRRLDGRDDLRVERVLTSASPGSRTRTHRFARSDRGPSVPTARRRGRPPTRSRWAGSRRCRPRRRRPTPAIRPRCSRARTLPSPRSRNVGTLSPRRPTRRRGDPRRRPPREPRSARAAQACDSSLGDARHAGSVARRAPNGHASLRRASRPRRTRRRTSTPPR